MAFLRQLPGPIQASCQHVLGNHTGPYKKLGTTPQATSWAHARVPPAVTDISQWAHSIFLPPLTNGPTQYFCPSVSNGPTWAFTGYAIYLHVGFTSNSVLCLQHGLCRRLFPPDRSDCNPTGSLQGPINIYQIKGVARKRAFALWAQECQWQASCRKRVGWDLRNPQNSFSNYVFRLLPIRH